MCTLVDRMHDRSSDMGGRPFRTQGSLDGRRSIAHTALVLEDAAFVSTMGTRERAAVRAAANDPTVNVPTCDSRIRQARALARRGVSCGGAS